MRELAIAIPSNILEDCQSLSEKTHKLGIIARAASIFKVTKIHVYKNQGSHDKDLILLLLRYLVTPQYLRKNLFPIKQELKLAGTLPPLRIPSHMVNRNYNPDVINIRDIGASYAQDISTDNMTKMNYVMYVWFMDNPSFLYDIEENVMRELTLEYDKDNETDMGCIARLVNMRKNDKVIIFYYSISIVYRHLLSNISFIIKIKNIASRGKATHQVRISKQRSSVEKKGDAGRRRPKVTRSFKLDDKWFNIDGSDYNDLGKLHSETHPNPTKSEDDMKKEMESMASELSHYKERVNEMQSSDKKV